ncbi:hypothetical protein BDZ89DRAFT_727251 [Hymenopellis radicata]|nr:hypothetical protein BDZ89DRAFT_727251 [Hymenopellis radicata]
MSDCPWKLRHIFPYTRTSFYRKERRLGLSATPNFPSQRRTREAPFLGSFGVLTMFLNCTVSSGVMAAFPPTIHVSCRERQSREVLIGRVCGAPEASADPPTHLSVDAGRVGVAVARYYSRPRKSL